MSVDHLPARTTADPHQPAIHLFWDEPNPDNTPVVLDAADVHRDWQQTLLHATSSGAASFAAVGAVTLARTPHTVTGYTLAVLAGLLVAAALVLRQRVTAEGRHWVLATDTPAT